MEEFLKKIGPTPATWNGASLLHCVSKYTSLAKMLKHYKQATW